jgi:hypothetical protein
MINSTSSNLGAPSAAVAAALQANGPSKPRPGAADSLSTAGAELLKAKLASEPEIRPEVVARGRELAADPSYPSAGIMGNVARQILQSPDPSEDQS